MTASDDTSINEGATLSSESTQETTTTENNMWPWMGKRTLTLYR